MKWNRLLQNLYYDTSEPSTPPQQCTSMHSLSPTHTISTLKSTWVPSQWDAKFQCVIVRIFCFEMFCWQASYFVEQCNGIVVWSIAGFFHSIKWSHQVFSISSVVRMGFNVSWILGKVRFYMHDTLEGWRMNKDGRVSIPRFVKYGLAWLL